MCRELGEGGAELADFGACELKWWNVQSQGSKRVRGKGKGKDTPMEAMRIARRMRGRL